MAAADEYEDVLDDLEFGPEKSRPHCWLSNRGDVRFEWEDTEALAFGLHMLDRTGVASFSVQAHHMPLRQFRKLVENFLANES